MSKNVRGLGLFRQFQQYTKQFRAGHNFQMLAIWLTLNGPHFVMISITILVNQSTQDYPNNI